MSKYGSSVNAVSCDTILPTVRQVQTQNIDYTPDSQKTHHTSPRPSYGASYVNTPVIAKERDTVCEKDEST